MKNLLIKNNFALRTINFLVLLSISFSILPLSVLGQTEETASRQLVIKERTLGESPRLALVIGNDDYQNVTKLKNAAADATDMAAALKELNFEVLSGINQTEKQMKAIIREFGDKLRVQKGIGLVFYAGHGVQSNGQNYLIPIDADIPREDEIEDEAVNMRQITGKFETAKSEMNIIILDACRNNPFAKEWGEARTVDPNEGIGKIAIPPKGTFMFYSTEPGKTASDGSGRNGLFTEALLANIKKPGLELERLYKVVANSVREKSREKQVPYREGNVTTDFYFAGSPANAVSASSVVKTNKTESEIKAETTATVEKETWDVIKDSTNPQDFREFLAGSPTGTYELKAKIILEKLEWDLIKTTKDKIKVQSFLNEFSDGVYVKAAKAKLRQLESQANTEPAKTEAETIEPVKSEPKIEETAKTEAAEIVEEKPVKKTVVPKASARRTITKAKPIAADANKFQMKPNKFGMELIYVPAGSFMMGASEANVNEAYALGRKEDAEIEKTDFDNEKSAHRVTFADGFWMSKTEVTQAQWLAVMGKFDNQFQECEECPVDRISWDDAKRFIAKLNEQNDGFEYRLPSEAEWEYAARGGKTGVLPVAASKMSDIAWYKVNSGDAEGNNTKAQPVGQLQPNNFGLYDMLGNVAEWCEDTYSENYENSPADGTADTTGNLKIRILRGGFFNDLSYRLRLTRRDRLSGEIRRSQNGLRIVAVEKK